MTQAPEKTDLVTLTIDGRQLSVPKGTAVLKAAIEAGIQVPYYCYHPGLGIDARAFEPRRERLEQLINLHDSPFWVKASHGRQTDVMRVT